MPTLFIGNKNYSSWSMRPWLALKWAGIPFEERVLPMIGGVYGKSTAPEIAAASPSGRVPALKTNDLTIWDSLSICEWAAEQKPDSGLLPKDPVARAFCRSAAAEMHSGFQGVRNGMTMNIRRAPKPEDVARFERTEVQKDIARMQDVWAEARWRFNPKGPYLFGAPSIADAFFTPVATRFRTYGAKLSPEGQAYCDALLANPAYLEWEQAAKAETWVIEVFDNA